VGLGSRLANLLSAIGICAVLETKEPLLTLVGRFRLSRVMSPRETGPCERSSALGQPGPCKPRKGPCRSSRQRVAPSANAPVALFFPWNLFLSVPSGSERTFRY